MVCRVPVLMATDSGIGRGSHRHRRRFGLLLGASAALAACGGGDPEPRATRSTTVAPAATEAQPVDVELIPPSPIDVRQSGLTFLSGIPVSGAPEPLVDLADIRSGGPPPDGIPSIDEPSFIAPSAVDFLGENEPVLAIDIDGDARAYPVQILMWHEIVNDTVAGAPVAVTYCPLCNSAVAYDRRIDGRVLEFGTSGSLWNSALVMFDRQTETLWSHFTGQAIVGELTGIELERYPVATVPWGAWRDAHPQGLVLGLDTGFDRDYGRNPYPGYDDVASEPFLFEGEVDGRYTAMTRMVGIEADGAALGVPLVHLQQVRVVNGSLGEKPVVVFWEPGTASALDAGDVADGDDVGATGAFTPIVDGDVLEFEFDGTAVVDTATGSTWDIFGRATSGPLAETHLDAVPHVDTFWFAWSTFRPDTEIIDG